MNKILFFLFISLLSFSSVTAQNIKLVFRYDDFALKSNLLNEQVVHLFQKHQIPLVLGVIPCDSNEKMILEQNYPFLSVLENGVRNQSIEIAQHGLTHIKLLNGEFGNLKREEQYRRMQKGKTILDSIFQTKIVTFIPPWNAYDNNTLYVMQQIGMKNISSALCIGQPWSNTHINYFPESVENFGSLISVLKRNENQRGVVVVMFHQYTFGKNYCLLQLDTLLTLINKLSYVKCVTFTQLYNSREVSDGSRMIANMESNLLYKYLHLNGVIQTTTYATFVRILNVLLYLGLSGLFFFAPLMIFRKKQITNQKKYGIGFLLMLFVGFSVWFHFFSPLKLVEFVLILSIGVFLVSQIQSKKITFSSNKKQ